MDLVIFDWNGTLQHDLYLTYASVVDIFKHYRIDPPSLETFRNEITANYITFYHRHGIPQTVTVKELSELRKKFFMKNCADVISGECFLDAHARTVLEMLCDNGVRMAIVSAEMETLLEERLRTLGIRGHFELVMGGAQDKALAIKMLLEQCGVNAADACYVDDSPDGIAAAKTLGVKTVGCTWGYYTPERIAEAHPTLIINELYELIPFCMHARDFVSFEKIPIAIVGRIGAGKETVIQILTKLALRDNVPCSIVRFSDPLKKFLDALGLETSRENYQKVPPALCDAFHLNVLTESIRRQISATKTQLVLLDGVRWESDVAMLREHFPRHLLSAVIADESQRFARVQKRSGAGAKIGEQNLSLDQFRQHDVARTEQDIQKIIFSASFVVDNNLDDLTHREEPLHLVTQVEELWRKIILPRLGSPCTKNAKEA